MKTPSRLPLCLLLALSGALPCPRLLAVTPQLVWDDEFNLPAGSAPDPTKWTYDLGGGGWGNNELETYTNSTANAHIVADPLATDGFALAITAIQANGGYTSARIKTEGIYSFTYGRMEVRARLPGATTSGGASGVVGLWPAFWALGNDISTVSWPACGEVDTMEWVGTTPDVNYGSLHTSANQEGLTAQYTLANSTPFGNAYHVFAVDWYPSEIIFSVDGVAYETQPISGSPFNLPFFMILNMAVGGGAGFNSPPNANTVFPQDLRVDYVRVYSLPATPPNSNDAWAPAPPTSVAALAHGSAGITVSWVAPISTFGSALTGYQVVRTTDAAQTLNKVTFNTAVVSSYVDSTGAAGTTYYYSVNAVSANGTSDPSAAASATVPAPPSFSSQPAAETTVASGAAISLSVVASGTPLPTYQWYFGTTAIAGATGASLTISSATLADAGSYTCVVTNAAGSVTSSAATVTVTAPPSLASQPVSQTIASGTTVVFNAPATGYPAPTYQWSLNNNPIAGATQPTLLISGATAADAGSYTCTVTNALGSVTTAAATLALTTTSTPGHLVNVSCRAQVGTGANELIMGYVIGGSGTTGSEPVLIRASGPALTPFGVTGVLVDPQLTLNGASGVLAADSGWAGNAAIASTAAAAGAFAWNSSTSLDSALLSSLSGGSYTAQIAGASGDTGVALAEVYDATPSGTYTAASPRLVNISSRLQVGTGGNILIAGFVIGGSTSKTVLIRGSGPALTQFGVGGVLPDPQLQLYSGPTLLLADNGWGGNAQIAATAATVGAFSWGTTATPDSALLVTLAPGAYTAQVSGASGDTGVALVEVYEVP